VAPTRDLHRMVTRSPKAGRKLRRIREGLGLSLRDVIEQSQAIAKQKRNADYALSLSSLSDIELLGKIPHVYRVFVFSRVYKRPLKTLLRLYGVTL
jgi:hypothetical protein